MCRKVRRKRGAGGLQAEGGGFAGLAKRVPQGAVGRFQTTRDAPVRGWLREVEGKRKRRGARLGFGGFGGQAGLVLR